MEAFLNHGRDFDRICDEVGRSNHSYVTKFLNSIRDDYDENEDEEPATKDEESIQSTGQNKNSSHAKHQSKKRQHIQVEIPYESQ